MKALPSRDAKKMMHHIFRLYDTNGDGTIDFVEFMVNRRTHSKPYISFIKYSKIDRLSDNDRWNPRGSIDEDIQSLRCQQVWGSRILSAKNNMTSDGEITKKELKKLLKDMHGLIKAEDADKASDDMIATTTLAEMDGNEDGKISLQEYITACLGKEEFSKMLTLKIIDIFVDEENVEEKGEPAE